MLLSAHAAFGSQFARLLTPEKRDTRRLSQVYSLAATPTFMVC